ncbi:MAG: SPOR domain-containing protein [Candidatus Rokubacteria bacterium]|nr:SPOR domain-containing protein [Candidatus Rokubacteria bacterium]
MAQYEMNLRDYWRIIRRRRVTILASALLVALFAFWFAWQKEPVYQSTSAIKFEQSTSLTGLLVEVLSFSPADTIETQAAIIRSFPVMEQVAKRLGELPTTMPPDAVKESKAYTAVVDGLAAKVKTLRVASTNILEITASSSNPRRAKDLANTVAEVYRDVQGRARNARIIEARQFIEQQLKELEGRVKKAEEAMWAFREANRVIAPGAESTVLLSLFTQIRGEIEKTRQQRTELELAAGRLRAADGLALREAERVYVDTANPAMVRLQATLADLMLERNNLALEVTDSHPRLQAINDRIREVRGEMLRELQAQIALLRNREEILNRQIGELFQRNREVPTVELSLQRLQREAKVNDDLLALMKTRHQEALIKEAEKIEEVTIIRPASEPSAPVTGETFNTVLVGVLIGLMLGLVLAFVQETLDTSIGTIEDVEDYLGVPVLGVIPHIDTREIVDRLIERRPALASLDAETLSRHALLVSHFDPKSPVAEAFRSLRTRIQFATMERPAKVFLLTSPTLQEGKTTVIVNLAITLCQAGQKTLLVNANLRRPTIHKFFGIDRDPGLTDVLLGNQRWEDCIRTVADILMGRFEMEDIMTAAGLDNLHILLSGPVPANPSELLSTPQMAEFLRQARQRYDIILLDVPPTLPVTDAVILGSQVDGVILVYQAGKVGRLALKRAKMQMESARANVWGVVLNDLGAEIAGYAPYHQYYTHYYGEEGTAEEARPPGPALPTRLVGALKGILSRKPAAAAPPKVEAATPPAPGRRYAQLWVGIAILAVLVLLLATLLAWRLGLFGLAGPGPVRELFRSTLLERALQQKPPAARPPEAARAPALPPASPAAPPAPSPDPRAEGVGAAAPKPAAPPAKSAVPAEPRYALEFGPFTTAEEAERIERQLNTAGFPTVRFRQQGGGNLYGVFLERVPSLSEAQAIQERLKAAGFAQTTLVGSGDNLSIRVGEPAPLRSAVQVADKLRAAGHQVRVAVQPGEALNLAIRHGNFASEEEARARSQDLAGKGLSNRVVRVK